MTHGALSPTLPPGRGIWPALALSHIDDVLDGSRPPRLVIVGPAGSDKSPLLAILREHLSGADERDHRGRKPTLFVDDAHLLADGEIDSLTAHLDDPGAGLVLACRPWPRSGTLKALIRRVQQYGPAVVLGQVQTPDVEAALAHAGRSVTSECVASLVEMSGSVTWLVREALAAHGEAPCPDPSHAWVEHAVVETIAERLETVDVATAEAVRRASLGGDQHSPAAIDAASGDDLRRGHAEGLLLRGGHAVPLVRTAVRRVTPVDQVISLLETAPPGAVPSDIIVSLGRVQDPVLAGALLAHADEAATDDADRALELYEAARTAGADPFDIAVRTSRLAWDRGDVDEAAALLDSVSADGIRPGHDDAVRLLGAVWGSRGFLAASAATYRAHAIADPIVRVHAAVAALGSGDAGPLREIARDDVTHGRMPTTALVSHGALARGLLASIESTSTAALDDLIRASEMYGESGERGPTPELPAVLAAVIAINSGELDTAARVVGDALMGEYGGGWARPRLLLWSAWIAVHRQIPEEAAARLAEVDASVMPLSGREVLLRNAVMLAYVRRYGSAGELRPLWERVRDDVRHIEADLFAIHPLAEFAVASAFFDDSGRVAPALHTLEAILAGLGDPPLWAAHLQWAIREQALIAGDRAGASAAAARLSDMAAGCRVAAIMSAAAEQGSSVPDTDPTLDRLEQAATDLAAIGLAWDGARLALAGAARTTDRRIAGRLTAFARQLHSGAVPAADSARTPTPMSENGLLSAREREVAALVLSGMTYAEIGEAIFISPRTAEHHIARIRRRLGATSRTDLISKLQSIVDLDDEGERGRTR